MEVQMILESTSCVQVVKDVLALLDSSQEADSSGKK